ncbi:MAG TPA: hypothetical protein VMR73_00515 [Candidatus Paceibacterota bacterium]|nr:hypothetical protein [Candidatus Paceibacterota bacterium]
MNDQNKKSPQPDGNREQRRDEVQMLRETKPKEERSIPSNDFLNALYLPQQG